MDVIKELWKFLKQFVMRITVYAGIVLVMTIPAALVVQIINLIWTVSDSTQTTLMYVTAGAFTAYSFDRDGKRIINIKNRFND